MDLELTVQLQKSQQIAKVMTVLSGINAFLMIILETVLLFTTPIHPLALVSLLFGLFLFVFAFKLYSYSSALAGIEQKEDWDESLARGLNHLTHYWWMLTGLSILSGTWAVIQQWI